jgi:putative peptidoglycan lipid II flippase
MRSREQTMSDTVESRSILASSAVMATGTVISRASGYIRNLLLAVAIGNELHADLFNIGNTIPNMLYILLAGGVFNAVLVPQLVRAMKSDADEGAAYTNRVITLTGLFLAGITAVLIIGAPLLMRLFLSDAYFTDALSSQRESVIDLARFCLPQVFFYGMFVLVGQVLNARQRFGPMMWAPIANNVISVAVLLVYLFVYGAASGSALCGGFSTGQQWLLGMGATVGIVAQFLVLVPYLRATGYRFRPRFDFRDSGLAHTLRLGGWTVAFVIVNQLAFTVVVRLASSGTADAVHACGGSSSASAGTGFTIYSGAYLLAMVPHAIVTVSLATATLPRLAAYAADGDLPAVGRQVADTNRTALALIVPFALLLPAIALPLSNIVWGYAAASRTYQDFALSLALFAPGLVLFTVHYLMLRGFYALERTRTVFWVQCGVAGANIVLAILFTSRVSAADTAPGLVVAFDGSYVVGAVTSYLILRHLLGGLQTTALVRFLVRITIAGGLGGLAAWGWRVLLDGVWATGDGKVQALTLVLSTCAVDAAVLLLVARALRVTELGEVVSLVRQRLGR